MCSFAGWEEKNHTKVLGLGTCQWNQTHLGMYVLKPCCLSRYGFIDFDTDCKKLYCHFTVDVVCCWCCLEYRKSWCSKSLFVQSRWLSGISFFWNFSFWCCCALWQLRDDVTTEEYNTFYKKTFNDSVNPQTYAHSSTKVCRQEDLFSPVEIYMSFRSCCSVILPFVLKAISTQYMLPFSWQMFHNGCFVLVSQIKIFSYYRLWNCNCAVCFVNVG